MFSEKEDVLSCSGVEDCDLSVLSRDIAVSHCPVGDCHDGIERRIARMVLQ